MSSTLGSSLGLPPIPLYLQYSANESRYVATYVKSDPQSQAALAYFQARAPKLTTPDALLGDYESLSVVLGAFSMSSQIGATALLRALMTQNPHDPKSVAARIGNPNYTRFATYMSNWSPPPLSVASNLAAISTSYQTNQFEQTADTQSPGLQAALYFTRTAKSATTLNAVMADPTLLRVVVTTMGLDYNQFGALDFTQQQAIIGAHLKVADLQNPAKVQRMAEQYLAINQGSGSSQSSVGTILGAISGNATGNTLLSAFEGATQNSASGIAGSVVSLFA